MSRAFILLIFMVASAHAQTTLTPNDVADERLGRVAVTHATVHMSAGRTVKDATMLIRDGRIVSVAADAPVPEDFVEVNLEGHNVYPAFIDLVSQYGLPETKRNSTGSFFGQAEVLGPQRKGAFATNDAVRADFSAAKAFEVNAKQAAALRKQGFGIALVHQADGIARGTSALVTLGEEDVRNVILQTRAARHFSLAKGTSTQLYPISKMGAVATLRQAFLDGSWYSQGRLEGLIDLSLQALIDTSDLTAIGHAQDWRDAIRLAKIGTEFSTPFVIHTAGDSYQRLKTIKALESTLIVPINFPKAKRLEQDDDAHRVSLRDLMHWEQAPANPARLAASQVRFALTSNGSGSEFLANLRLAVKHGLAEETAIEALTQIPAELLSAQDDLGQLAPGYRANFFVVQGNLFDESSRILSNWVNGTRYPVAEALEDYSGTYALSVGEREAVTLSIKGKPAKPVVELAEKSDTDIKPAISIDGDNITLSMPDFESPKALMTLDGWRSDAPATAWSGIGSKASGQRVNWSMTRTGDLPEDDKPKKEDKPATPTEVAEVIYPFQAYGQVEKPAAQDFVIRNATVWTNEEEDVLSSADVLVIDGRIAAVGPDLDAPGVQEIDGTDKHVTPGIIDEHSHIALSSVNDIATNSAMVRMADVIDSEDVDIYRNLAGGVTAAQLLHGSANPIGGQSALVKLRWGSLPDDMLIEDAAGFIKFALGENVKRSSNPASIRYPQTRMGVEQFLVDAFGRASSYADEHKRYAGLSRRERSRTLRPRRDLALEALAEILASERFITAHSYVQSEINMLMHVADQFGFAVNTFTHILEGYKVADKMASHGAGGSTFSDWWAYKWEVRYAIPYNANLMQMAGVVTAINSDSAEMSRRLNQEAAKSVKYGGMSESDAVKLVTLNPAKLLRLDHRMGSLRAGKDADLVIWSGHPLSIYTQAETTFVDGVALFDHERDLSLRESMGAERARLVGQMRQSKRKEKPGKKPGGGDRSFLHCDSLDQAYRFTLASQGAQ